MPQQARFSANPITEWLSDDGQDRDMKLCEDFWYDDPNGRRWLAPKGSRINGASIPRPLWSTVGSPYTDDYRRASIVHDVACVDGSNRSEADEMFYHACCTGGCSKSQAALLYLGVRIGAWAAKLGKNLTSRSSLLYRLPNHIGGDEAAILAKYAGIAIMIELLGDQSSFEEIKKVIDSQL